MVIDAHRVTLDLENMLLALTIQTFMAKAMYTAGSLGIRILVKGLGKLTTKILHKKLWIFFSWGWDIAYLIPHFIEEPKKEKKDNSNMGKLHYEINHLHCKTVLTQRKQIKQLYSLD